MKSIRTKILVVVISGLLILSLTIGGIVLSATNKMLFRDADVIMDTISEQEASKLNDTLGDIEKSIHIIANAIDGRLSSLAMLYDQDQLVSFTDDIHSRFENVASNTEGLIAYYFRYNPELNLPKLGFYRGVTENGKFENLPMTDLRGDVLAYNWWYEPVEAKGPLWIAPYYHNNTQSMTVSYVEPIYENGVLLGIVGMDIQLSLLLDAARKITPFENGYAYLLSRTGEELYHPDKLLYEENNEKQIVQASKRLNNGMTLVVCAHYGDIQAQSNKMLGAMLLASFGVVCVFILLTILTTRKIVGPLRRLAAVSETIGEKPELLGFDYVLKDEVGVLHRVLSDSNYRLYEYRSNLQAQVYRDSLTGLKNRTAYDEIVAALDERLRNQEDLKFGVMVFDINNLKEVNDSYGHDQGNVLLIRTAKMISAVFHRSRLYRIGGDEFVVILENADYEEYKTLLEQWQDLCNREYLEIGEEKIPVSAAYGVAIYEEEIDSSFENVFHRADNLMYRRKREMKEK